MKTTLVASLTVLSLALASTAPLKAETINRILPSSLIAEYCADKANGSEFHVEYKKPDGTIFRGKIECGDDDDDVDYRNDDDSYDDDEDDDHDHDHDDDDHDDDDDDDDD